MKIRERSAYAHTMEIYGFSYDILAEEIQSELLRQRSSVTDICLFVALRIDVSQYVSTLPSRFVVPFVFAFNLFP